MTIDLVGWIVLIAISLGALVTGVGLILKAFSFQSRYVYSGVVGLLGTIVFTAAGLAVPMAFLSGQEYLQDHLFADLLMFGISGLVVVGILCFIVDHLMERPNFLMLAASACFAILLVPWIYIAFSSQLNDSFKITIVKPEPRTPRGPDPLSGERATLVEAEKESSDSGEATTDLQLESAATESGEPLSLIETGDRHQDAGVAVPASTTEPTQESSANSAVKKSGNDWLYDDP